MEHEINQTDYINYIQKEFEPGTREYNNIIQLYSTLYIENQIESYGGLAHKLIRFGLLYEMNEAEKRG